MLLPFLGYLYSLAVRYVRSVSGRKRFNVLAALHLLNHDLVTITNHDYINAHSVCQLLDKLKQSYDDLPIKLILDNARYQKCKLVFAHAEALNIELVFLPAYSPNLNLIERLWKFVKKEVLYNKHYQNYDKFCHAITDCLSQTHSTHKPALDTLLAPEFQTFQNVTFHP